MTYMEFHFVFTLPAIAVLLFTLPRPLAGIGDIRARWAIPLLCVIAFTYTTPWDNYLVARSVWWYGPERVIGTIGYVPIEEYMFFILQPILTGLFLYHVLSRWPRPDRPASTGAHVWGSLFWAVVAGIGFGLLSMESESGVYMVLIISWAGPVLAGMWLYDGRTLWRQRQTLLVAVGLPTLYLWVADAIAIRSGIWTISERYTFGIEPFGLPVEEATFFLMTNLLVVKGILLLLCGDHETVAEQTTRIRSTEAA